MVLMMNNSEAITFSKERESDKEETLHYNSSMDTTEQNSQNEKMERSVNKLKSTESLESDYLSTCEDQKNNQDSSLVKAKQSDESEQPETPKILIQRVFQQSDLHIVERKLDFVIAKSETEISKHVFGGLFNTKYYPYIPENYCKKHAPNLFEYENEELPKIGDKFDSHNSFRLYIDGKAKEWKYYLKCADSHRKNGKDTYVYKCVFSRPRSTVSKAKGLRKRTRRVPLHDCPCRVLLKPVPSGAKDLTVIYVCNHHDHPLTDDYFYKLQHGRRLHPSVKEELMDLLSLDVDKDIVRKYFEILTGYSMSYGYFANMLTYMKKNKIERQFSLEKLKEMSKKIDKIKEELGFTSQHGHEDSPDDDFIEIQPLSKDVPSKIAEVFNVLNSVNDHFYTKRSILKRNHYRLNERPNPSKGQPEEKINKLRKRKVEADTDVSSENVNNKSRLETRLQQLKYDEETLQNIKHLQDSVRTPCVDQPNAADTSNRCSSAYKGKHQKSPDKNVNAYVNPDQSHTDEPLVETITASSGNVETAQSNNEIFYDNEITLEENGINYIVCEEEVDLHNLKTDGNISYCIKYEENEETSEPTNESYILLDSLENMPLQVQATEFATVRITAEDLQGTKNEDNLTVDEQLVSNTDEERNIEPKVENVIEVIEQPLVNGSLDLGKGDVYEVIETDSKKILPNRDLVRSAILNKEKQRKTKYKKYGSKLKMQIARKQCDKKPTLESKDLYKYKKRKNRRSRTGHDYGNVYSSEDDIKFENEQLFGQLSLYGVDLNQVKDDDHYIIVVGDLKDEDKLMNDKHFIIDDGKYSRRSGVTELFNDCVTTDDESHQDDVEESIHQLIKYKKSLKTDVKELLATKSKLMQEIEKAKTVENEFGL